MKSRIKWICLLLFLISNKFIFAQIEVLKDSLLKSGIVNIDSRQMNYERYTFSYEIDSCNIFYFSINEDCKLMDVAFAFKPNRSWLNGVRFTNRMLLKNFVLCFSGSDSIKSDADKLDGLFIILNKQQRIIFMAEFKDGIKVKEIYRYKYFRKKVNVKYKYQIDPYKRYEDVKE